MSTSADTAPSETDVAADRPAARWSVQEGDWAGELPDEVAALLAPPVVVTAGPDRRAAGATR